MSIYDYFNNINMNCTNETFFYELIYVAQITLVSVLNNSFVVVGKLKSFLKIMVL